MPPELTLHNPLTLAEPKGYSHAAVAEGKVVALAGQIGSDETGVLVSDDLVEQFRRAVANLHRALEPTGATPGEVMKVTIYVLDVGEYRERAGAIGEAWREVFRYHYPPMTLVQVAGLYDEGAKVEIEAWAVT